MIVIEYIRYVLDAVDRLSLFWGVVFYLSMALILVPFMELVSLALDKLAHWFSRLV